MSSEDIRPPKAFVLMPFDPRLGPIFEQLICPALEDLGYEVARADTQLTQQNILRDIIAGIAEATLIVADLTTLNPNVMYELGIAHGLQIPTVLITQSLEEVPFDLRAYRVVQYSSMFADAPKLLDALKELGARRLEGTSAFGSPVLDFLGARNVPPAVAQTRPTDDEPVASVGESAPELAPDPEPEAPKGFLDFAVASEEETDRMTVLLNQINSATRTFGARLEQRTAELSRASDNVKLALAVSVHAASDMTTYAEELDAIVPEYSQLTDQLSDDLSDFVTHMSMSGADDRDSTLAFRATMSEQGPIARESLGSIAEFRQTVNDLPPVSQATNAAKRRLVASLDGVIGVLEKHEALSARVVDLIDAQLAQLDARIAAESRDAESSESDTS